MEMLHQLGIDPKVLASAITGFLLLWAFLARYLFRPILGLIEAREQDIKSAYENADRAKAEAQAMKEELEQRIAEIDAEARAKIQAAINEAQNTKDQILAEARAKYDEIIRKGQEDLAREKDKTLTQLREEIVNLAIGAAEKLIGDSLNESKHRAMINEIIDGIATSK